MTDYAFVKQVQDDAATVLARLIISRDDVIRVGMMDVTIDGRLLWRYMLAFVKDPETVKTYLDLLGLQTHHRHSRVDLAENAGLLLLPWIDSYDMEAWLEKHFEKAFPKRLLTDSQPMNAHAWASQLASIELLIVPGAGMDVDGSVLDHADIHRGNKSEVGATVTSIYEQAYLGRHGLNTQAIIGPRRGVRFFRPDLDAFED